MLVKISKADFKQYSKQLSVLVIPILITQVCQAAMGMVDAIMAGRISTLDLAAISIGAGVLMPIFLLAMGICMATTALVGEAVGQNDVDHAVKITQQALWMAMVIGIIGFVLLNLIPLAFNLLGVPANIQPLAKQYLFYIAFGFPAVSAYTVLRAYTELLDSAVPVAVISIFGLLLNIPLNYIFMYGKLGMPALGGTGCGISSAIVMWLTVVFLVAYLSYSKKNALAESRFYKNFAMPDFSQITKILLLGIPIGISIFFESSLFSLAALIISPLGELAVASHQIALSVTSQLFMIPWSISLALTIMIANKYGERDFLALRQIQTTGLIICLLTASVSALVIYLFRGQMTAVFTSDVDLQILANTLLVFAVAYQIFDAWQINLAGILRGVQDTAVPMCITFFSYWLVALPLGSYLARYTDMGVTGFWSALIIGLFSAALLLSLRLFYKNKQLQAV